MRIKTHRLLHVEDDYNFAAQAAQQARDNGVECELAESFVYTAQLSAKRGGDACMNNLDFTWQPDLSAALHAARQARRFVLADFSKEH
jgi:hypothetical protein